MKKINPEDIKKLPHVGKFGELEVYQKDEKSRENCFAIVDENFAAYVQFSIFNGGVKTNIIWNSEKFPGTARKLLTDYIIPRYKIVESDDILSSRGFRMWEKMMLTNPEYDYYVRDYGKMFRLTHPKEIYFYKDVLDKDPNSVFIVKFKK